MRAPIAGYGAEVGAGEPDGGGGHEEAARVAVHVLRVQAQAPEKALHLRAGHKP